jgi:type II secretory ATPase GspE/PulE/Tfp pilus assembly ATPase PilB-like protein
VAQRLVRKICPYCKQDYPIKEDIVKSLKLNLEGIKKPVFSRGKGCPNCFNLGYSGRMAIAEILLLTPAIRELILNRAQEHVIKQRARLEGTKTLREEGIQAALAGVTTLEEVLRVTAPDE